MKVSTSKLKKELANRQEELKDYLTVRLIEVFNSLIHEEFSEEEDEIHIYDLIVRIILRADQEPAESIADLMVLSTPENCFDLRNKWTLSNSAAFIRDYLKKDYIHFILDKEKTEGIKEERTYSE